MVDGYTITSFSTMISGTTEIINTTVLNLTEVSAESDGWNEQTMGNTVHGI